MSTNKKATEVKKVKKATKVNTKGDTNMSTNKKATEAAEARKVDIQPILKAIPETFTPALLDKLFNLNDGGKTVRRHLRKHFAEAMKHEHKDKWTITKANIDIIQYFADRYAYDLKVLEPAPKTA